jgi:hypothetical protein
MALTELQRNVCRLLAEQRIRSGESYVAGGVGLKELLGGDRISRDIDLFDDTEDAVDVSWSGDRAQLESAGFTVHRLRERLASSRRKSERATARSAWSGRTSVLQGWPANRWRNLR